MCLRCSLDGADLTELQCMYVFTISVRLTMRYKTKQSSRTEMYRQAYATVAEPR